MIKFGTAGNPEVFYESGGKSSLDMPEWLEKIGLNAYEYQCGRGIKISDEAGEELAKRAEKHGITLSVHSPYFMNISSVEPEKTDKATELILDTAKAAHNMRAKRIVVHMGSAKDITRRHAMEITKNTIARTLSELKNAHLDDVTICLETMGKLNQMGTIEEVAEVCLTDERLLPAIDFGHLNARSMGGLSTEEDFDRILKYLEKKIGHYRATSFHAHFSKIEYTKAGEKKHLTFSDTEYGPEFLPLAKALIKRNAEPIIICESAKTQSEDALYMKKIYEECKK